MTIEREEEVSDDEASEEATPKTASLTSIARSYNKTYAPS